MDPFQRLLKSRGNLEQSLLVLDELEQQLLSSRATADVSILESAHQVRARLQDIGRSLDTLILAGAPASERPELRETLETLAEKVQHAVDRVNKLRLQAQSDRGAA